MAAPGVVAVAATSVAAVGVAAVVVRAPATDRLVVAAADRRMSNRPRQK